MNRNFRRISALLCLLPAFVTLSGCGQAGGDPAKIRAQITAAYPHDPAAYTQGLLVLDGFIYESTGLYGQSSVRRVDRSSGEVLQRLDLPKHVFGEGLAYHGGRLFALTWRSGIAYEIDPKTLEVIATHSYEGEGWGLTSDGRHLIMSDGTSTLRFMNPDDFSIAKSVRVRNGNQPVSNLNELEYVDGRLYANIYMQDRVVVINPKSGGVTAEWDLTGLRSGLPLPHQAEVLNGIAHDPVSGNFIITGKRWPLMYEMELLD